MFRARAQAQALGETPDPLAGPGTGAASLGRARDRIVGALWIPLG